MKNGQDTEKLELFCNCCGRKLKVENGLLVEDALEGKKEWGYFSKKDTRVDSFVICEECCDKIAATFQIPVRSTKKSEIL